MKRAIDRLATTSAWIDAGAGFTAKETPLRLVGWSRQRRVILLRRRVAEAPVSAKDRNTNQPRLSFAEIAAEEPKWDYRVLVTSLDEELSAFGQIYRDRGDCENVFDELKNQWGWGGFTTEDLARCRLAARLLALF